jgi:hypothetical protein
MATKRDGRRVSDLEIDLETLSPRTESVPKLDGLVLGELAGFDESGDPLVQFHGNPAGMPVRARTVAELEPRDLGREIALMFEGGDPSRPIALGAIRGRSGGDRRDNPAVRSDGTARYFDVDVDDERLEIRANREITLRVGRASITLTQAGKVLIRGTYVLSRSSGVNRIKGGAVQIN